MATNNAVNVGLSGSTGTGTFVGSTGATLVTPASLGVQQAALNMNSHQINSVTDPTSAQDAATKNYVDQTALNGTSVYAATAANLTVTQAGAGVGATLTNAGAMATFSIDGVNPPAGSNVLVKNIGAGGTAANYGIYTVTDVGSGASNWVLTRATSYDTATEINNTGLILVQNGTTLVGTAWYNAATIVTVDTTAFSFSQFGNIVFPVTLAQGGTGASLTASNGGIFYSGAATGAILSGTATAGLALLSGASTTPSWSTKPPITQVNVQTFTTGTSTYTPTTGTKFAIVEGVGPGGGSGGAATGGGKGVSGGAGGGGYFRKLWTAANIGANATVVVGAAGTGGSAGNNNGTDGADTTVTPAGTGSVLTGGGGKKSNGSAGTTTTSITLGGAGGTASGGDINIPGGNGSFGIVASVATSICWGGSGGGTAIATQANPITQAANNYATAYGAGGNGTNTNDAGADASGTPGAAGVVIITEFISV